MTAPLLAALLILSRAVSLRRAGVLVIVAFLVTVFPILLMPVAIAGGLGWLWIRARRKAAHHEQLRSDVALLADLVVLGLTGGLGLRPALEIASAAVGGEVADEVEMLLRSAQVDGLAATLSQADGAGRDLYQVLGRAASSGAALADQVTRIADEMHADLAAGNLERMRRVPVAMLFPLALLILPGFLLLTVAPAILDAFLLLEM